MKNSSLVIHDCVLPSELAVSEGADCLEVRESVSSDSLSDSPMRGNTRSVRIGSSLDSELLEATPLPMHESTPKTMSKGCAKECGFFPQASNQSFSSSLPVGY